METAKRIDVQTRRRSGKSAIRNRKEKVGSVKEEGIDVQRRIGNCKEQVEARQAGIDGERKGNPAIRNRKEAELSESEVEREVQRLWERFAFATKKVGAKSGEEEEERRRIWLSHPAQCRKGKEKVGEAERKNQQTIKETLLQGTEAAGEEQLSATGREKGLKSGLEYDDSDPMAVEAASFRRQWNYVWTRRFGSYEDITRIPPMIYTDKKREPGHSPLEPMETLQVFSVKIVETAESLPWPLDVFGMVVARDVLDHNRNVIFHRTRDNCQTISTENPYLELTGPSRAIVVLDPVHFEVMLRVKGSVQSEDQVISFLVVKYDGYGKESRVLKRLCPSKLSTVELTFGSIVRSVEATISVQVVAGSWPDGFRGEFTASTTSLDDMKIQLLDFGDGKFPVSADGIVKLSRRVVSVELKGELIVSVKAVGDQAVEWRDSKVFGAQKSSRRKADVEVGSCKMKVTVAWSLLSDRQYFGSGLSA